MSSELGLERAHAAPMQGAGRGFRILVSATAIITYLLVVLGAIVRVTGSGMGCGDEWPLCYGSLLPPPRLDVWIEWTHRLVAALIGWLTLGTVAVAVLRYRRDPWIVRPALLAVVLFFVQALLGAITVWLELPPTVVALHLANAMFLLASLIVVAVSAFTGHASDRVAPLTRPARRFLRLAIWSALAIFVLIVSGAYVVGSGASYGCPDWPLCRGEVIPTSGDRLAEIHMLHRYVAAAVGLLIGWMSYRTWQRRRQHTKFGLLAASLALLFVAQVGVGAVQVWTVLPPLLTGLHLALASAVWGVLVVIVMLAYRERELTASRATGEARGRSAGEPQPATAKTAEARQSQPEVIGWTTQVDRSGATGTIAGSTVGATIRSYLLLTKPPIVLLLLFTTLAAMLIAANGDLRPETVWWTMLGGALSAGGAGAVNSYLDRDIDGVMRRTRRRPVATGAVSPRRALAFGLALGGLSALVLVAFVNPLSALLSVIGFVYYTVIYTRWLKRSTPSNIIIGGAAGAIPPLVGWAAATNSLDLTALYLFAIIFYWTPPHTWALMLMVESDYARAGVPMLPVVRGEAETRRQIVLYSLLLVGVTLVLYVTGAVGTVYLLAAAVLGGLFVLLALLLLRSATKSGARRLYKFSTLYLALIFLALVVDQLR